MDKGCMDYMDYMDYKDDMDNILVHILERNMASPHKGLDDKHVDMILDNPYVEKNGDDIVHSQNSSLRKSSIKLKINFS